MDRKPQKRAKELHPLSHDHHHGLLLCWKIRQGLKKNIDPERIMKYAREFFRDSLEQHFYEEEKFLFPLLGLDHPMIKKACKDHKRLRRLFLDENDLLKTSSLIEEELEAHIRFEERELFNQIQKVAGEDELDRMNKKLHPRHKAEPLPQWPDQFWNTHHNQIKRD